MNKTPYLALLLLGLAFACSNNTPIASIAEGGTTSTGGGRGLAGATANAGAPGAGAGGATGAAGAAGRICYTEPRDPSAGGAISVYELYPETLCYVPTGVAGAANKVAVAGGAAGAASADCPAATDPNLLDTLNEANPQSLSSIWPVWIIDGPTQAADASQCCYNVCMSFNGA